MFQHRSCKEARFSVQSPFSILMTPLSVCVIFSVKTNVHQKIWHMAEHCMSLSSNKHFIHSCISTDLVGVKNLLYISVHEFESQKILIFFINLFKVLLVFNFELIEINFMKNLSHFFFLKRVKDLVIPLEELIVFCNDQMGHNITSFSQTCLSCMWSFLFWTFSVEFLSLSFSIAVSWRKKISKYLNRKKKHEINKLKTH